MPLPVISQVIRAAMRGTCVGGQKWQNVLHFHRTAAGAWSGADIIALDAVLVKLWHVNYAGGGGALDILQNSAQTWDDTVYTPLDGTSASTTINSARAGAAGGASLPPEVSLVATLRTAKRGRSYRGRVYMPPFTQAQTTTLGYASSACLTFVTVQWNGFASDLAVNGPGTLVVASYLHSTSELVTGITVDNKFDVQRRRK